MDPISPNSLPIRRRTIAGRLGCAFSDTKAHQTTAGFKTRRENVFQSVWMHPVVDRWGCAWRDVAPKPVIGSNLLQG